MKKTNVVRKDDYESYRIYIPLKVRVRFNCNKYIFSELEKLHPCFSDDFCIDSKRKLYKGKIFHEVIVMNKYKLAEYRNRFPDKNIYLENGRKIFELKKSIKKYLFVLAAFFPLIFLFWEQLRYKSQNKIEEKLQPDFEENFENQFEYYNLTRDLFEKIRSENGRIEFFEWKKENSYENCTVAVNFLFPEQLNQLQGNKKFSPVKMNDGKSCFTVQLTNNLGTEKIKSIGENINRMKIREIFSEENILILEESYEPVSLKFVSNNGYKAENSRLFTKLEKFFEESGICIQHVFLKGGNKNELTGEITFTTAEESKNGLILGDIDKNIDLFFEISQKKNKPVVKNEKTVIPGVKIGEIRKNNGITVTFYKNENGKILKVEN